MNANTLNMISIISLVMGLGLFALSIVLYFAFDVNKALRMLRSKPETKVDYSKIIIEKTSNLQKDNSRNDETQVIGNNNDATQVIGDDNDATIVMSQSEEETGTQVLCSFQIVYEKMIVKGKTYENE